MVAVCPGLAVLLEGCGVLGQDVLTNREGVLALFDGLVGELRGGLKSVFRGEGGLEVNHVLRGVTKVFLKSKVGLLS